MKAGRLLDYALSVGCAANLCCLASAGGWAYWVALVAAVVLTCSATALRHASEDAVAATKELLAELDKERAK